jgi:hypothetical protein
MLRFNLLSYRDLWAWLDAPFKVPIAVGTGEQMMLIQELEMELDSKRRTTWLAKCIQPVLTPCLFKMRSSNLNYLRQQCLHPPLAKGERGGFETET